MRKLGLMYRLCVQTVIAIRQMRNLWDACVIIAAGESVTIGSDPVTGKRQRHPAASVMRIVKFFVVVGLVLGMLGGGLAALAFWHFNRDLPDYQQLADYAPPIVTRIHAGDGRLLAEYATERRVFVPIGVIPLRVVDAFLAAEDKNFYSHHGIDVPSILRAALTNFEHVGSNRRP